MRVDSPSFAYANLASEKYPRFVVGLIFDTDSLYFTSHVGIPNVPGVVLENVLTVKDARSQHIYPDEGRSEIGVVNFDLLDLQGQITESFATKLDGGAGLRGKKVVLYYGWKGADFSTFQKFQTQVVLSLTFNRGVYSFRCNDITREQRQDIFDPKVTTLSSTISDTDTTITVASAAAFQMIAHGASYEDAASSTVGYLQIEDEKIRYTGTTSSTFTGCTRGVLGTRAVPHAVDVSTPDEQKPEVKEVIYFQMPLPKTILAILTGVIYGQSANLPDHWHLGIAEEWVRESDFTGIGQDLWNPDSDSTSFVARFLDLAKTDGKTFLETECYMLAGCFPVIYSDGTIGIKRMNRILFDAAYVGVLDETNIESWSALTHDMESVANDYLIEWNIVDDKPTRTTELIDATSIALHGQAPAKDLTFKGLYGSRHTDATVRARIDALRDRYAHPPALLDINGMPHLNVLEVGDIVRVRHGLIRDYPGTGAAIDRSMEVQGTQINLRTGDVTLNLFGSTGLASASSPDSDGSDTGGDGSPPSPDSFYGSQGTDLSTVVDMTQVGDVWVINDGEYDLVGAANATDPAAIYYFAGGDLQIPEGATLNISGNVQLRVQGFLEINGHINGVGTGNVGVADASGYGTTASGTAGLGTSIPMDGVAVVLGFRALFAAADVRPPITAGILDSIPVYDLVIVDGSPPVLQGLPADLQGTSGGPGGKILNQYATPKTGPSAVPTWYVGGTGANGGAGLITITRGLSAGVNGVINLSGGNSSTPSVVPFTTVWGATQAIPGAGGAGCPGAWLLVLDGQDASYPDLSGGRFIAACGTSGAPRVNSMTSPSGGFGGAFPTSDPLEGYTQPGLTDGQDMSNSAIRIQYLAGIGNPAEDQPAPVPAPSDLAATGVPNGIVLNWSAPDFDLFDGVEIYAASSNDRTGATKIAEVKSTSFLHALVPSTTRYYWIRNRRAALYSDWEPSDATSGVSATSS